MHPYIGPSRDFEKDLLQGWVEGNPINRQMEILNNSVQLYGYAYNKFGGVET